MRGVTCVALLILSIAVGTAFATRSPYASHVSFSPLAPNYTRAKKNCVFGWGGWGGGCTRWKYVVTMMMENHSFDNMLGWLPGVGDLDGSEYNLLDPSDPNSEKIYVGKQAAYCT